jgi:hypothetical protein
LLRNIALRGGTTGRTLRKLALGLGKGTIWASQITPVLTDSQHFDRGNVNLGISRITRRLLLRQNVPEIVEKRRRNYLFLLERLRGLSPPLFESLPAGNVPLFYPLLVEDNRATVKQLLAGGIEAVHFWRDFHPACDAREFPEVAKLRSSIVEVPCHQDLTLATMAKIADVVRDVIRGADASPARSASAEARSPETGSASAVARSLKTRSASAEARSLKTRSASAVARSLKKDLSHQEISAGITDQDKSRQKRRTAGNAG